jgi:hypothetical protein
MADAADDDVAAWSRVMAEPPIGNLCSTAATHSARRQVVARLSVADASACISCPAVEEPSFSSAAGWVPPDARTMLDMAAHAAGVASLALATDTIATWTRPGSICSIPSACGWRMRSALL